MQCIQVTTNQGLTEYAHPACIFDPSYVPLFTPELREYQAFQAATQLRPRRCEPGPRALSIVDPSTIATPNIATTPSSALPAVVVDVYPIHPASAPPPITPPPIIPTIVIDSPDTPANAVVTTPGNEPFVGKLQTIGQLGAKGIDIGTSSRIARDHWSERLPSRGEDEEENWVVQSMREFAQKMEKERREEEETMREKKREREQMREKKREEEEEEKTREKKRKEEEEKMRNKKREEKEKRKEKEIEIERKALEKHDAENWVAQSMRAFAQKREKEKKMREKLEKEMKMERELREKVKAKEREMREERNEMTHALKEYLRVASVRRGGRWCFAP
jgi:hypothetical protein